MTARRPSAPARSSRRGTTARSSTARSATSRSSNGSSGSSRGSTSRSSAGRGSTRSESSRPGRGRGDTRSPSGSGSGAASSRRSTAGAQSRAAVERSEDSRQVTMRTVVLVMVVLVAFVVLAPTLRAYLSQQEQLRSIDSDIAQAQERTAQLEADIERWSDDTFVQTQARDRLGFVMPGETPYQVVDPGTVTGEEPGAVDDGPVTMPRTGAWYLTIWDSVQVAGEAGQ